MLEEQRWNEAIANLHQRIIQVLNLRLKPEGFRSSISETYIERDRFYEFKVEIFPDKRVITFKPVLFLTFGPSKKQLGLNCIFNGNDQQSYIQLDTASDSNEWSVRDDQQGYPHLTDDILYNILRGSHPVPG